LKEDFTRDEETSIEDEGSSLIRDVIFGGLLVIGASLFISGATKSKPAITTDTEHGEIRISREALERFLASGCQDVYGVESVSIKARMRGRRTILEISLDIVSNNDTPNILGNVLEVVYRNLEQSMDLQPDDFSVNIKQIRTVEKER